MKEYLLESVLFNKFNLEIRNIRINRSNISKFKVVFKEIVEEWVKNNDYDLLIQVFSFLFYYEKDLNFKFDLLDLCIERNINLSMEIIKFLIYKEEINYYDELLSFITRVSIKFKENFLEEIIWKTELSIFINKYLESKSLIKALNLIEKDKKWESLSLLYALIRNKKDFLINSSYFKRNSYNYKKLLFSYDKSLIKEFNNLDTYKKVVLYFLSIEFKSDFYIWELDLIELLEWLELNVDDYDLIYKLEDKERLLDWLKDINNNKNIWLIFVNNDFKWLKNNKKWLEELIYKYPNFFIWYSKDKLKIKECLNIYARKWSLKIVINNKDLTLYFLEKWNKRNDDILKFDINEDITMNYLNWKMINTINDFLDNKLNNSNWKNYKVVQKNTFFKN